MPNLSDVNFTKPVPIVIYFDMSVTSEVREKVRRRRVTRQTQRCEGSKRMYTQWKEELGCSALNALGALITSLGSSNRFVIRAVVQ